MPARPGDNHPKRVTRTEAAETRGSGQHADRAIRVRPMEHDLSIG
jgi:hypothetical protein